MKKYRLLVLLIILLAVAGCAGTTGAEPMTPEAAVQASDTPVPPTATPTPTVCNPPTVVPPTLPAEIPGYTELDESTGLHVTGTALEVDLETYRLEVTGLVDNELSLTYDELRCLPKIELYCTLVCPGFFQDEATWAGARLDHVLEMAGLPEEFHGMKLISADGYSTIVSAKQLETGDNFLAYELEGEPIPALHGFPVRAVFPGLDGNKWIKWLIRIEVY
jgi:DMSO/TMAO reductase YedYZ molybdopterin-dependent catalytic subunit